MDPEAILYDIISNSDDPDEQSYLLRALADWCKKGGFIPKCGIKLNGIIAPTQSLYSLHFADGSAILMDSQGEIVASFEYTEDAINEYNELKRVTEVDVKVDKVKSLLECSDIVWGQYGTDTISELATRIVRALEKD